MQLFHPTYTDKATGEKRKGAILWVRARILGKVLRESTGCRTRKAALAVARKIVDDAERRAVGAPVEGDSVDEPLAPHLEDFLSSLAAKERKPQHQREVRNGLEDYVRHAEARNLSDLDGLAAERWLQSVRLGGAGISARTFNRLAGYLKQFGRWLERKGRIERNPFRDLEALSVEADRRLERRALTPTELERLLVAAPPERARVYLLACTSGLRRGELAQLTWGDLDLDVRTLRVRASTSKNKRTTLLALPRRTVAALAELQAGAHDALVFGASGVPPVNPVTGRPLKGSGSLVEDLEAAGIPYRLPAGVLDFHALRGTFATLLANAGVPLPQVQALMRHSSPQLTARFYVKHTLADARAALSTLEGSLPGGPPRGGDDRVTRGDDPVSGSSPLKPSNGAAGVEGDDGDDPLGNLVLEEELREARAALPAPGAPQTLPPALPGPGDASRRHKTYARGFSRAPTKRKARESTIRGLLRRRRHPDSNRGMTDLQSSTSPVPAGLTRDFAPYFARDPWELAYVLGLWARHLGGDPILWAAAKRLSEVARKTK